MPDRAATNAGLIERKGRTEFEAFRRTPAKASAHKIILRPHGDKAFGLSHVIFRPGTGVSGTFASSTACHVHSSSAGFMVVTLHQIANVASRWSLWPFRQSAPIRDSSGGLASLWVAPGLRVHNMRPDLTLARVSLRVEAGAHNNTGKKSCERAQYRFRLCLRRGQSVTHGVSEVEQERGGRGPPLSCLMAIRQHMEASACL